MAILLLLFLVLFFPAIYSSVATDTLRQGSSLSVERPESNVLVSPNGLFSAGFHSVGENAFSFAVWFTKSAVPTVVWTANRDQPVNGRGSILSLTVEGNLVLLDAGSVALWSTGTTTDPHVSTAKLKLRDDGNLVVVSSTARGSKSVLWESFKFPTDTLLPGQELTVDTDLVSSRSEGNSSSGYYRLFFDDDNVLKLLFQGPDRQISSLYWPSPWLRNFENERFTYNNSKTAVLDTAGLVSSSDHLFFSAFDYGENRHRRLVLDPDGNLRIYSWTRSGWAVTWQAITQSCVVHGICGPNSFCSYSPALGRRCDCIEGFKKNDRLDWNSGCEPDFTWENYTRDVTGFLHVPNAEFYGYDRNYLENRTLHDCEEECLKLPDCQGFQFKFTGTFYNCYHKAVLLNGQRSPSFDGDMYIRVPKAYVSSFAKPVMEKTQDCPQSKPMLLNRTYRNAHQSSTLKALLWVSVGLAGVELVCVAVILSFLYTSRSNNPNHRKSLGKYMLAATRFQEFKYAELRKATHGFRDEIGSGAGGTVYKGVLADGRVAAIKQLREAHQSGGEFLAEVSTIGGLNHKHLIEMWGYCTEGKHRLLVYEYMEHGSLAAALYSGALDWDKRFQIALGTAKGLAYLHEECLEWVLHCDVKPHNILLDSDYGPKVADFGLSKLQKRDGPHESPNFSRIRGTRGYMAPEWVYNLPITSKVDVYSYGIVALELVTGRKPTGGEAGAGEHGRVVRWVREKVNAGAGIEEIADATLEGKFERREMEVLMKVAMQCAEEETEARPTMRQVLEMLQDEHSLIFN